MKNLFLIVLAALTLLACSKDDDFTIDQDRLEGFWLLTDVTGGISGTGYEANFDHLQINDGQVYSLMVQDAFIQEGSYELSKENNQLFIQFIPTTEDAVVFDDDKKEVIFSEQDSKLTLTDPCCDLFVYHFEKEGE
jgi:hypothetical protein